LPSPSRSSHKPDPGGEFPFTTSNPLPPLSSKSPRPAFPTRPQPHGTAEHELAVRSPLRLRASRTSSSEPLPNRLPGPSRQPPPRQALRTPLRASRTSSSELQPNRPPNPTRRPGPHRWNRSHLHWPPGGSLARSHCRRWLPPHNRLQPIRIPASTSWSNAWVKTPWHSGAPALVSNSRRGCSKPPRPRPRRPPPLWKQRRPGAPNWKRSSRRPARPATS